MSLRGLSPGSQVSSLGCPYRVVECPHFGYDTESGTVTTICSTLIKLSDVARHEEEGCVFIDCRMCNLRARPGNQHSGPLDCILAVMVQIAKQEGR